MMARTNGTLWQPMAGIAVLLAAAASGCLPDPTQVKWEANGVQVTRLDMPLAGSGYTFLVTEYALEGQEGAEQGARAFRDRFLLTTHLRGRDGHVVGFATRTYADGTTRAFGLSGTLRPVWTEPGMTVVTAYAHPIGSDGGPTNHRPRAWVQLRLDVRTGRISAKAP